MRVYPEKDLSGRSMLRTPNIEELEEKMRALERELSRCKGERASLEKFLAENRELVSDLPGIVYRLRIGESRTMDFFNDSVEEMTGYAQEELKMGKTCSIDPLIVDEDHLRVVETVENALAANAPFEVEYRVRHKDGSLRHFMEKGRPAGGEKGAPAYVDGLIIDLTDRKKSEEAMRQAYDEMEKKVAERTAELSRSNEALKEYAVKLEQSNRNLQEFAYAASHDLKEPLRKIQTFSRFLKKQFAESLDDKGRDYLSRIEQAASRMTALIMDVLSYSGVSLKADPFAAVDLTRAATEALSNLEVRRHETGGRILVERMPVVEGDHSQLVQLFQNLLDNALKFHREGEAPVVKVYSEITGADLCRICVEDNGIGFEERYLEQIFYPFQCLHGRSQYEGTGIGLAICRRIAERHGGVITAESRPGEGSKFVVTLPVKSAT